PKGFLELDPLTSPAQLQPVKIWDLATGKLLLALRDHTRHTGGVAFSPDGRRLASASGDGTVRVWEATTGQTLHILDSRYGDVRTVASSPDGRRLASAGFDNNVRIWDVTTGQELLSLRGHADSVTQVTFSRDGRLASGSDDGTVMVWNAVPLTSEEKKAEHELLTLSGFPHAVNDVVFSRQGGHLAAAGEDGTVRIYDTTAGQDPATLRA